MLLVIYLRKTVSNCLNILLQHWKIVITMRGIGVIIDGI